MRIHLISGPRNISTALMYSFAQRADMSVVDEPFYGYFLKVSGRVHPGGEEVLQVMETNPSNRYPGNNPRQLPNTSCFL
jgi:hypothetical protein